ncbi:hypothetical protein OAN46_00060 [Candidatus Pelagibacter sp.]|nr:hypothetical protein [Candidatus Pelagibacter sp.]
MNEDPKIINDTDKPLNQENIQPQKVDIHVLKARAQAIKDKENIKNSILILVILTILAATGILFSL